MDNDYDLRKFQNQDQDPLTISQYIVVYFT